MNYYLLHKPSMFGMGSDTDSFLVTEDNLRKIMSEAELRESMRNCSTYENIPDLTMLPNDIPVTVEQLRMKNVIFRVFNQFWFERDVIAGEALFNRYHVDLSDFDGYLGRSFTDKTVHEFMDFDLKHVSENHFFLFYKAEDLLEAEKDRVKRLEGAEDWIDQYNSASANIKKFEHIPDMKDEYYEHFYHQKYPEDLDFKYGMVEDGIKSDDVDHTKCAYNYPLLPDTFGCEIRRDDDPADRLRYDELFNRGTDVKHLIADYIGDAEWMEGFKYPQIDRALKTVFGYD